VEVAMRARTGLAIGLIIVAPLGAVPSTPAKAQVVARSFVLSPNRIAVRHILASYRSGVCIGRNLEGIHNGIWTKFQRAAGLGDLIFGFENRVRRGESCHHWNLQMFQVALRYNLRALPQGAIARALLIRERTRARIWPNFAGEGVTQNNCRFDPASPGDVNARNRRPAIVVGRITLNVNWAGGYRRVIFTDESRRGPMIYRVRSFRFAQPIANLRFRWITDHTGGRRRVSAWDVTRIVNAWVAFRRPNRGLVITPTMPPAMREMAHPRESDGRHLYYHCIGVMGTPRLHVRMLVRQ
jgi:hypothetical protein